MTATGSRSAVPTGEWGRPARLRPTEPTGVGNPVVDLRDVPVERPHGFRPTPPPPAPPGARSLRAAPRRSLTARARIGLEAATALLLLVGLAALVRPPGPAPLTAQARWESTTADRVGLLARDMASAADAPTPSPVMLSRLRADLRSLEAAGPPPDPAVAAAWGRATRGVEAALARAAGHPASARSDLRTAGLELTNMSTAGAGS